MDALRGGPCRYEGCTVTTIVCPTAALTGATSPKSVLLVDIAPTVTDDRPFPAPQTPPTLSITLPIQASPRLRQPDLVEAIITERPADLTRYQTVDIVLIRVHNVEVRVNDIATRLPLDFLHFPSNISPP